VMGLDVSHGCWSGSYSRFDRWRMKIVEVAGYSLSKDCLGNKLADIDWDSFENENYYGKWRKTPKDILLVLIVHSDCEGKIYRRHQLPLAQRLEELLPLLPSKHETWHSLDWQQVTKDFIEGLRYAHSKHEIVEFY
jgi:hypothetical protein